VGDGIVGKSKTVTFSSEGGVPAPGESWVLGKVSGMKKITLRNGRL